MGSFLSYFLNLLVIFRYSKLKSKLGSLYGQKEAHFKVLNWNKRKPLVFNFGKVEHFIYLKNMLKKACYSSTCGQNLGNLSFVVLSLKNLSL